MPAIFADGYLWDFVRGQFLELGDQLAEMRLAQIEKHGHARVRLDDINQPGRIRMTDSGGEMQSRGLIGKISHRRLIA